MNYELCIMYIMIISSHDNIICAVRRVGLITREYLRLSENSLASTSIVCNTSTQAPPLEMLTGYH